MLVHVGTLDTIVAATSSSIQAWEHELSTKSDIELLPQLGSGLVLIITIVFMLMTQSWRKLIVVFASIGVVHQND